MDLSQEKFNDVNKYLNLSQEGIWCFAIQDSLDTSLDEEYQVQYIINNSMLVEANEIFAKMYGYENREEILGISINNLFTFEKKIVLEFLRKFIRNNYSIQNVESLELGNDGEFKYFLNSSQGILEGGRLLKFWGVQKDITEIKLNHLKLIKLYDIELLIGSLAKKFIQINIDSYDRIVNDSLKELGVFTKVDRVYIFKKEEKLVYNTFEWCNEGIEPFIDRNQGLEIDIYFNRILETLIFDNKFVGYSDDGYGGLSKAGVDYLKSQGVQSILLIPLYEEKNLVGIVGYDSVNRKKIWKQEDIELLSIFADMLSIVTDRIKIQKELVAKDASLKEFYDRINCDLEIARSTQKHILSLEFPDNPIFHVTSLLKPFDMVSGDIISYFENDDNMNVLFGDVSGHGVSSAMVGGMVVLSFKNSVRLKESPSNVLNHLNRDLKEIVRNHHVSAVSTCFSNKDKKMLYSYAGHPPLALIRNGRVIELEGMNTPLLTIEKIKYYESELNLIQGDRIIYFSDGCFEVFNRYNEFLGLYSFLKIIENNIYIVNSDDFIKKVIDSVVEYCNNEIRDDLTMLVLDVK